MLGFALCVVGAFLAGYAESLHSTAGNADSWILKYASILGVAPNGTYLATLLAQTNSFVQQNVTPVWTDYLVIGVAIAIFGAVVVAIGDRKTKNAGSGSSAVATIPAKR